jgi:hypothetical protein
MKLNVNAPSITRVSEEPESRQTGGFMDHHVFMDHHKMELWATALTFSGSALLAVDVLSPVSRVYWNKGAEKLATVRAKLGGKAPAARPRIALDDAKRSQWLARPGFLLMTLGFFLDFLAKW